MEALIVSWSQINMHTFSMGVYQLVPKKQINVTAISELQRGQTTEDNIS